MIFRLVLALSVASLTLFARQGAEPPLGTQKEEAPAGSTIPPIVSTELQTAGVASELPEHGLHHDLVVSVVSITNSVGVVSLQTNTYWHFQPGANFLDESGGLRKSNPKFEVRPGYAVAEQIQHKVQLAANINTEGHVVVTLPDGSKLVSQVSGLRYFDPESGKGVVLSNMKDSSAYIINDTQVVYDDAFEGTSKNPFIL